jgi:hypothetical protein
VIKNAAWMRKTQLFSIAMNHQKGGGEEEEVELYSGGGFPVHTRYHIHVVYLEAF